MKSFLIIITVCFLFPNISCPQNAGSVDTLTLQQAINIALQNNLNIQIADKEIKKNNYTVNESKAALLPSLSGKSHYLYAPESGYDPAVTNGGEYGLQLSADYTLYDGGLNHLAVSKADKNVNLSELNLDRAKSELTSNVRSVFYEIDHAKRGIGYQAETLKSLEDYYNYLKEQHAGGNASESDLLKTEVDLNNAKIDFEDEILNLKKLKNELFSLLFMPADTSIVIENITEIDTTLPPEKSIDDFIDVKIAETEAVISQFDVRSAQAERLPVIDLSGDAGVLGVKPDNYKDDVGYSANVNINIPIFSWGAVNAKIEQAAVAHEQSKLKTALVKQNIKVTRDSLAAEFQYAKRKMEAYKSNVKTAEDNFYYSKALYMGGGGSTLEVLDAYRLLNDARTNYNNSILTLQQAKAELLKLYGE